MVDLVTCGAINWDINFFVDILPRTGEEVRINKIQRVSGGTAANVSVAAARILGRDRVALIGAVGYDEIGDVQIDLMMKEGVDTSSIIRIKGEESGQAYITIDNNGENEIHTYFGANHSLSPIIIKESKITNLINEAKIVVIMDPPLNTCRELAEKCKDSASNILIWDPGVLSHHDLNALKSTITNIDYFVLNHVEFQNLLGTSNPKEVGKRLASINKNIKVIIKRGKQGCTLFDNREETVFLMGAVPLEKIGLEVINTVGCGDAFIGAFASAKVEGYDDIEAMRWGCAAGAYKATRIETRGSPTFIQLGDILKKWARA
jgi:ribokinase